MARAAIFFRRECGGVSRTEIGHTLRLLIGRHVEGDLLLLLVDDCQIVHCIGVVRIYLKGALVGVLRPVEVASVKGEVSQAIVDRFPVDAVLQRLDEQIDPLPVGFLPAQCLTVRRSAS